jgi:NADPH:quinone reductase-like Zn-dependent oxidoreductase
LTDQLTQSTIQDLDTRLGTAMKPDGTPVKKIKLPHIGGHEGVGRIIAIGPGCTDDIKLGGFVGIRFAALPVAFAGAANSAWLERNSIASRAQILFITKMAAFRSTSLSTLIISLSSPMI